MPCWLAVRRPMEVTVDLYSDAGPGQVRAVAFVSPDWQCIADGLPPSSRSALPR